MPLAMSTIRAHARAYARARVYIRVYAHVDTHVFAEDGSFGCVPQVKILRLVLGDDWWRRLVDRRSLRVATDRIAGVPRGSKWFVRLWVSETTGEGLNAVRGTLGNRPSLVRAESTSLRSWAVHGGNGYRISGHLHCLRWRLLRG